MQRNEENLQNCIICGKICRLADQLRITLSLGGGFWQPAFHIKTKKQPHFVVVVQAMCDKLVYLC